MDFFQNMTVKTQVAMVTPIMTNTSRRLKNVGRWIIGKAAIKVGSHLIYSTLKFEDLKRPPPKRPHSHYPQTSRKIIPPPWYGGGEWMESLSGVLDVSVFWNDLTFSGKPLIFLTKRGIFYGWWRCWRPVTSPTMVTIVAAILDFNWMVIFVLYIKNNI